MTPRYDAALGAVRIREGRERRANVEHYGSKYEGWVHRDESSWIYPDRRTAVSPRAAEFAAEIERLRGMLAALEQDAIDDAKLASGSGAGAGEGA